MVQTNELVCLLLLGIPRQIPWYQFSLNDKEPGAHDTDLRYREEAPDCRLFTHIGGKVATKNWSKEEQDAANNKSMREGHDKHWSEHHEEVEEQTGNEVAGRKERYLPGKMKVSMESAELLSSHPLTSLTWSGTVLRPVVNVAEIWVEKVLQHHKDSSKKAEFKDGSVAILIGLVHKSKVTKVGKERLEADVEVADECEELVDLVVTVIDPEVLEALEQLHEEEVEHANADLLRL